jgi:hypothetical protein
MEGADEKYPPVLDERNAATGYGRIPIPMQSTVKHLECCNRYAVDVIPQDPATAIAASHYAISNVRALFIALSSIPRGINENAQAWTAWGQ